MVVDTAKLAKKGVCIYVLLGSVIRAYCRHLIFMFLRSAYLPVRYECGVTLLPFSSSLQLDGNSFLYTRHLNIYFVAVTRGNVNPAMVFEFLYQKIRIFKAYFKRDFDEDTLRNNMTLILELMDGEEDGALRNRASSSVLCI